MERQPVKHVVEALGQQLPVVGQRVGRAVLGTDRTEYWYYNCSHDEVTDSGWGCGYRCLQMVVSSIPDYGSMPTIGQIQSELAALEVRPPAIEGSETWIEPPDCSAFLLNSSFSSAAGWELPSAEVETLHRPRGQAIEALAKRLWAHFEDQVRLGPPTNSAAFPSPHPPGSAQARPP